MCFKTFKRKCAILETMKSFVKYILFLCLTSCSGYKFSDRSNPLIEHNIRSLSIPMFLNQSSLSNTSAPFTKEFIKMMSSYNGLRVRSGFSKESDAVLLGIVKSQRSYADTVENNQLKVASQAATGSIGSSRQDFYIPSVSRVRLYLQIVILKNPTDEELKLLRSKFGSKLRGNRKIILNETINLTDIFNREIFDGKANQINTTQNVGGLNRVISSLALEASNDFRDIMLYAF